MSKADDQQKLQTAFSLHQTGNLSKAAELYREILNRNPQNFNALHYLGVIEASFGNFERAKSLMARSLSLQPLNVQFAENYATLLFQLGDYNSALQVCDDGLQLSPANVPLLYVSAISLFKLRRFQDSAKRFDNLLSIQPNHIAALNEQGSALAELKRYDAAFASVEKALGLQPNYAEGYLNKGNLCVLVKRYDEAIVAYDKALALKPDLPEAWLGRGNILRAFARYGEAFAAYDKASALKPDLAAAWLGRGNVFLDLRRYDEAFAAYDKAFTLEPDLAGVEGARLHTKMHLCDWNNLTPESDHLISSIRNDKANSNPFFLFAIYASRADQRRCAELWVANKYPASDEPIWQGERYNHGRIRIAYLSADFRDHPVPYLMASVFEKHDRERFETIAISFGPDDTGEMRKRLQTAFDQFIDVRNKGDADVAKLLRTLEIDIAVDLTGHTTGSRTPVLAYRSAPIQVNYLGYAGTMGADYIDYLVADQIAISPQHQNNYSEKIVYLPFSFMPHDLKRIISERNFDRADFGLPQTGFVFCCFNSSYKFNPHVFALWMDLLEIVDGSVLWLSDSNSTARSNLSKAASARGINPDRLIFAKPLPSSADHLARHRLADLFLDTFPYNAHTTASDALWAGLPVLTQIGETFPARVAASLLHAIGLPELITSTQQEYTALAIELATNPEKLAAIKLKLLHNRPTTALFNTQLFMRHIEMAYMAMYERYRSGLPPDNIFVPQ